MAEVVVAHPAGVICECLGAAFTAAAHHVIGTATDEVTLRRMVRSEHPALVLIDHDFTIGPPGPVWQAVREEKCKILVLGRPDQRNLLDALEAGADGFLSRESALAELEGAAQRVLDGETYIPPGMLGALLRELIVRRRDEDAVVRRFNRLSRRERQILGLIVAGVDPASIAGQLYLSPHTVRTHVQNVIDKLEVHSRIEAASLAVEYELLSRFPAEPDA